MCSGLQGSANEAFSLDLFKAMGQLYIKILSNECQKSTVFFWLFIELTACPNVFRNGVQKCF